MPAEIVLPWPPSVNHLWRRGKRGGLYLSRHGREYRREVWAAWVAAGRPMFGREPVRVVIEASPPDHRRRDLDNIVKAVLDALVACGCLVDDWQVEDLHVVRTNGRLGQITVRIGVGEAI